MTRDRYLPGATGFVEQSCGLERDASGFGARESCRLVERLPGAKAGAVAHPARPASSTFVLQGVHRCQIHSLAVVPLTGGTPPGVS